MSEAPFNVLFLCTGNSLMDRRGAGRFKGYVAGSFPTRIMHPLAPQLRGERGTRPGGAEGTAP